MMALRQLQVIPPVREALTVLSLALRTPASVKGSAIGREDLQSWEHGSYLQLTLQTDHGCLVHGAEKKSMVRLSRKVFPDQLVISSLSKKVKVEQTCVVYFQNCTYYSVCSKKCKRM